MSNTTHKDDIDQLNSFLRGEISAVETYVQALGSKPSAAAEAILRDNKVNHESRVALLRAEVKKLGGEPADGSGPWGAFARAIEGGAKLFGTSVAISALEEGEEHGLNDYRGDLDELSPGTRTFVVEKLLGAQQATYGAIDRLTEMTD